jgi:hypothetical protein
MVFRSLLYSGTLLKNPQRLVQVQSSANIRTNPVIELPFWAVTGYLITGRPKSGHLVRISNLFDNRTRYQIIGSIFFIIRQPYGYSIRSEFSISELKFGRLSRFYGYRASGYRILTVNSWAYHR